MKLINKIKEIWGIEELRTRILNTLLFLLIFRLGSFVILPGVNPELLNSDGDNALIKLIATFSGGAFTKVSIFALGIMPYISASIVMQLMTMAVPAVQKMQKEGESGRKRINAYTRILTVAITLVQAPGYLKTYASDAIVDDSMMFYVTAISIMVASTMFIMWLGEKITDRGIGNGVSLLITVGIIAQLIPAFSQEIGMRITDTNGGLVALILELVVWFVVVVVTIMLVQGVRRVPLQSAKQVAAGGAFLPNREEGGRDYLPLKVNIAGVMPIIFAQAVMFVPITIANLPMFRESEMLKPILMELTDATGFAYNIMSALMIVIFTYFYTAMVVDPRQMADDFKRQGAFIPGVRPGSDTRDYLDNIMSKLTLPGSLFLAAIAILPAFAKVAGISQGFAYFFGGTSLLIMVGVVLDTLQQIESYLLMKKYDGFLESGKLRGRAASSVSTTGIQG
jgi:preprotein translocase subunit SecY